jgi:DNA processing protein
MGMEVREAYIILNLLPDIGPVRVAMLLESVDDLRQVFTMPEADLARIPKIGSRCAGVIRNWERHCRLDDELRRTFQANVQIVTPADADYPAVLKEIHDPPLCLYCFGCLDALHHASSSLAVVGSRLVSHYGESMTRKLTGDAVRAGWTVVSGLARGVDTMAHNTALQEGGCTIAVLGSGLNYLYPPENIPLARRIAAEGGLVITELPMLMRPDRRFFPMRNRIISGLCRGTLVVEAGISSGSLITAAQAMEQGRSVFAVPGRADSPGARGCNALIRDGACLVEEFSDILDEFSLLPSLDDCRRARRERQEAERKMEIPVPDFEYRLWTAVGEDEVLIDDVVVMMNEPASAVLGAMLSLEIRQLLRQVPGKRVRRCPNRIAVPLPKE